MNKVKLKSQISGKSIDELFDYQTKDKIIQYFTVENNRTFYKNNNNLESKQLDLNETFNPLLYGNEFLFSIEKVQMNENDQKYYFVSKSNYPSLKLSYHNYRLNSNIKERDSPTWLSLYNFNYEINETKDDYVIEQRRRKNFSYFLKNKKNCYELNVGDVIKLGRISLILTKIHLNKNNKKSSIENNENNFDKKSDNNKVNDNTNMKDIYQEFHLRAKSNKLSLDKNLFKKYTFNTNEQTDNVNVNNDNNNSFKDEIILKKEEIKINEFLSDKNIEKLQENIIIENLSSKDKNNSNELKEKMDLISKNNKEDSESNIGKEKKSNSTKNNVCRICYCDEDEANSPLVNLCNCSGDVKYIHLKCLFLWLQTKSKVLTLSNDLCKQITFNKIHCEICKEKYPEIVFDINKNKVYQVYKPEEIFSFVNNLYNNYIILESFELINQKKIIYIVSFDEKNLISIGRGVDCDIRLTDVTVSRKHSVFLRTKENKIILKDAGSKFGTLILLQAKKVLITQKILSIQIGKLNLNFCICYYSLNCLFKLFNIIFCWVCHVKKKKKKKNEKKNNNYFSNNKCKNDYLNDSNSNMIINNYIYSDLNILDYNKINTKNIIIEDLIDVKIQINENKINNNSSNSKIINDLIKQFDKKLETDKSNKKSISIIESFNNLNMAS
jgi:hypothetical protein